MNEKAKRLTAKENAAVEYYCEPTSDCYNNWCKACCKAGYAQSKGWKANAFRTKTKDYIKKAIIQAKAVLGEKIDISREYCVDKLQDIIESKKSNDGDRIRAMSLIGDFCGYKREMAPNSEKEAAKRALISKEDKAILEDLAKIRLKKAAQAAQAGVEGKTVDIRDMRA